MASRVNKRLVMKTFIIVILCQLWTKGEAEETTTNVPDGFLGTRGKRSVGYMNSDEIEFPGNPNMQGFAGMKREPYNPYKVSNNMFANSNEYSYAKRPPVAYTLVHGYVPYYSKPRQF